MLKQKLQQLLKGNDMKNPFYEPIRTYGKYKDMDLYTKNQLKKKNMVPKKSAKEYELWTNGYKQKKAIYYELSDCRAMTHQEIVMYKDNLINYWQTKYTDLAKLVLFGNQSQINEWKVNNEYLFKKEIREKKV